MLWVSFTGGELWLEDDGISRDDEAAVERKYGGRILVGKTVDVKNQFFSFSPKRAHGPQPWSGTRWTITAFTPRGSDQLSESDRSFLIDIGLPMHVSSSSECRETEHSVQNKVFSEYALGHVEGNENSVSDIDVGHLRAQHASLRRLIADQEQYLIAEVSLPEVFEGGATSEWLQRSRGNRTTAGAVFAACRFVVKNTTRSYCTGGWGQ